MLNRGLVSWCSTSQATVALSSIEAGYIALTLAAKEATWLRLLTKLGLLHPKEQHAKIKISLFNTSAMAIKADQNTACGGENRSLCHCQPESPFL